MISSLGSSYAPHGFGSPKALGGATYSGNFGVATAIAQEGSAAAEIAKAVAGYPLSGSLAEMHAPDMLQAPANRVGASIRAAYWQAVAARIARGRGDAGNASTLLSFAQSALGTAAWQGSPLTAPMRLLTPTAGEDWYINDILSTAETRVRNAGIADVAAILNRLRSPAAIAAKQEQTQGGSGGALFSMLGLPSFLTPGRVFTAGALGFSGLLTLIAVGVGIYFAWPFLSPIVTPMLRQAGSSVASAGFDWWASRGSKKRKNPRRFARRNYVRRAR